MPVNRGRIAACGAVQSFVLAGQCQGWSLCLHDTSSPLKRLRDRPDPYRTTLTRWGNALGVWLYRRSDGRITGPARGSTIGLLTVPGRNTGIPRTVAIGFFPHGAGYLVAGSGSGSRQDPQWFRNLRAAARAQIQIGVTNVDADVRIAGDTERDTLWREVILAQDPRRGRYQKKAGRVIPVAVLTPHQLRP